MISAVGVVANVENLGLEALGVKLDRGVIAIDGLCRTNVKGIYAIGDMTRRPMPHYGDRMFRLESVPNAVDQARAVAADIMGKPLPAPGYA